MLNGRSDMSHFLYKIQSEPRVLDAGRMYLGSDSSELAAEKGLTYGSWHKGQLYYKICFIPLWHPIQNQKFTAAPWKWQAS